VEGKAGVLERVKGLWRRMAKDLGVVRCEFLRGGKFTFQ
jgi:hypothetical protein